MAPDPPTLARRAFWPRAYARRRLGTERAAALAPLHYALVGERLGFRPNGFFDPRFYRERASLRAGATGLLAHYLARPDGPDPSAEFDGAWYAAENPDWRATHPHPFLHFLEAGLASGRRPRADIDMGFVRDVIRGRGRSMEEAAMRVFDPKPRDGEMKPPLTHEELRARQERFYADGGLRIEREAPAGVRNRLVFVQCGRGFDAPWLNEPRSFDVLLNGYEQGDADPRADAVVFQAGTKTTAIRRLLAERPDCLLSYEAALFLDDDIELSATDIEALFAAMAAERLDLAQPALTADSECAWPFLKRPEAPNGVFRGLDGRDHGAPDDAPRARGGRLGLLGDGQRLGDRSPARPGGARRVRGGERRRHRVGRGPARAQGRSFRRRLLRLSAPLWNRPGARGQPRRRRFRGRALAAAAGARGAGSDLFART